MTRIGLVASATLMLTSLSTSHLATAAELSFTYQLKGAIVDAYQLDTTAGVPSFIADLVVFPITQDKLGLPAAYFGDASKGGVFGAGPIQVSPGPGVLVGPSYQDGLSTALYSGAGVSVQFPVGVVLPTVFGGTLTIAAVPEPPTLSLFVGFAIVAGAAGLGARHRRCNAAPT